MNHARRLPAAASSEGVFEQLKEELANWHTPSVAEASGVSPQTIYYWLDGHTKLPRLDTVVRVAEAIGLRLRLEQTGRGKAKKRLYLV